MSVYENPEIVVGALILSPKNRVLILKSKQWRNHYLIPGGHVNFGETLIDALVREIFEETGLTVFDVSFLLLHESIFPAEFEEKKHFVFCDYVCRTNTEVVKINEESESFQWCSLDELEKYEIIDSVRELMLHFTSRKQLFP